MTARWYRGDCHVHSVHSDGELTPEQLTTAAQQAGLDFLATTDHNTAAAHGAWPDGLLVITGAEVTTHTGHWLALGIEQGQVIEWDYGVRDGVLHRHLGDVRRVGGLSIVAHPHGPHPFAYPFRGFDAVEVWNGQWTSDLSWNADNEAALAEWGRALAADIHQGRWRPAIGNSDAHLDGQLGLPHTVVRAEELSALAILDGIRAGRSWIAESAEVDLSVTAVSGTHTAGIGERLTVHNGQVVVRAEVRGVPDGTVSFHTERGRAGTESLSGRDSVECTVGDETFVRVEVRHENGRMAALTNPITLG